MHGFHAHWPGMPEVNQPVVMSKMLSLGMEIDDVIEATTYTPAVVIGCADQIGTLREGSAADVTVFEIEDGTFEFPEYGRGKVTCGKRFAPRLTILKGEVIFDVHCGRQDTCTGIGVSSSR